jgi:hypothetical protein
MREVVHMNRIKNFFIAAAQNLKTTFVRFPAVLVFLAFIAANISILIENDFAKSEELYGRLIFSGIFGAFLSVATQFLIERFEKLS